MSFLCVVLFMSFLPSVARILWNAWTTVAMSFEQYLFGSPNRPFRNTDDLKSSLDISPRHENKELTRRDGFDASGHSFSVDSSITKTDGGDLWTQLDAESRISMNNSSLNHELSLNEHMISSIGAEAGIPLADLENDRFQLWFSHAREEHLECLRVAEEELIRTIKLTS